MIFEEVVITVEGTRHSLLAPCVFRLRRKVGQRWERASIELAPRSAYLLRGAARKDWQHSIPPVDNLRYSVTFRSLLSRRNDNASSHRKR